MHGKVLNMKLAHGRCTLAVDITMCEQLRQVYAYNLHTYNVHIAGTGKAVAIAQTEFVGGVQE
jgi:hypothetical protein